ncbi:MAG: DnaJ domain-containing protein [Myxococcota bacterium]|nr:DnaJ domain-containing protein [Myxococcota bacterium]
MSDARARTPKLVPERRDLREVPLSPTDGFVLSQIDGVSDEHDIIVVTGLQALEVETSLAKLELLGVITLDVANTTGAGSAAAVRSSPVTPAAPAPSNPRFTSDDGTALGEDVDLDVEIRKQILEVHRSLGRADHYVLLGVDSAADKKTLRRAYFELASKFHPDRYFRKRLGSFKQRMETIFGRLTLAHETLSNKDSRSEYDQYLEEQRRARSIEDLLAQAMVEAKRAEESIEREVRAQTASPLPVGSSSPAPSGTDIAAPVVKRAQTPATPMPVVDVAARRDALARRLLGGRSGASSAPPARASMSPHAPPSVADAMDTLRRRYEDRVIRAKAAQARKYAANAEEALAQGDPVAAANAFRVARSLSPNDRDLEHKAQQAQEKADAVLSETYSRQAEYEEKTSRWAEAARSWTRVCKARPTDPEAHERAASALVKANGDLHEAGRLADRACALDPPNARYRVTLANVYLAAGLALNGLRELETAAQLAPHDGTIQAMMKRIGSRG